MNKFKILRQILDDINIPTVLINIINEHAINPI